jgi:hypothetical protein
MRELRAGINEGLQAWFDDWLMEYKADPRPPLYAAAMDQIMRARDRLARVVWSGVTYDLTPQECGPRNDCKVSARVIGEHRSKGIRLPVYQFERPDLGIRFTARGNPYDWKLSVESERPILSDLLPCLFNARPPVDPGSNELAPGYFDGFPSDRIFGCYSENFRRWSASIYDYNRLWTAI